MKHTDTILRMLSAIPEPIGSLVRAFPGAASDDTHWIDKWFVGVATGYATGKPPKEYALVSPAPDPRKEPLDPLQRKPASRRARLRSIQPHYFRGFRAPATAVALTADLIVIEGANSTGKTSLTEAFEWLFTGQLSRRESGGGHPRELANCIANEFRPPREETWVEAELEVDGMPMRLKRVLVSDYSELAAAEAQSALYVDGNNLAATEEAELMTGLFAGVAPILMQHTLRQFVHDNPERRRMYFERLLQIDELTVLIEQAVVGDARALEFLPDTSPLSQSRWLDLQSAVAPESKTILVKASKKGDEATRASIQEALVAVAVAEFTKDIKTGISFTEANTKLEAAHETEREQKFPFLNALRPQKEMDEAAANAVKLDAVGMELKQARAELSLARNAASKVTASALAVSRAMEELVKAGLVDGTAAKAMTCPVCEYDKVATLTPSRVAVVRAHVAVTGAADKAQKRFDAAASDLSREVAKVRQSLDKVAIKAPTTEELKKQSVGLDEVRSGEATAVREAAKQLGVDLEELKKALAAATKGLGDAKGADDSEVHRAIADAVAAGTRVEAASPGYGASFRELESALSVLALSNRTYALRARWLGVAADLDGVVLAIKWQDAKQQAQKYLKKLRSAFMELRTRIIDDARQTFSDRMTDVWKVLRRDTASSFSRLSIPAPKGRGYKLEIEVKAELSDGGADGKHEVDALKVFSESQVNVLGLAAYVTRARLLGHGVLIFDDPVQSMDDEHHRSFAGALLNALLAEGFQVVVLTHSDDFARDIADQHYDRPSYATITTRMSEKTGCEVDTGRRRVSERLVLAEDQARDGKLKDGWTTMRHALERLYTLAYVKGTPGADGRNWRKLTAEAMWNGGAGVAIEKVIPGAGIKLKDILAMTAGGAHDKMARGATDLLKAVEYVRRLLAQLGLGDG